MHTHTPHTAHTHNSRCFLDPSITGYQYTFVRDMRMVEIDGVPTCVCVAKSAVFPNEPEKEGIVRVDDFQQACVLQSDGKTGSRGKFGGRMWAWSRKRIWAWSGRVCGCGQARGFG